LHRGHRRGDQRGDPVPGFAGQTHQHLHALRRIADGFGREFLELFFGQKHDIGGIADDHAGSGLVCEPGIEGEAELGEKP
jgi:hypothetical protein